MIAAVPLVHARADARHGTTVSRGDAPAWRPLAGDILSLRVVDATPGAWVVEAAPGVRWRLLDLPGAQVLLSAHVSRRLSALQAQDVLPARVLTSLPRITIQLLSDRPHSPALPTFPTSAHDDAAALRMDPAVFHRIAWRELDALALTRAWEVLLQRYGQGLMPPQHASASASAGVPLATLPWTFPVFAWGGLFVTLFVRDDERAAPPPRGQRRPSLLRLLLVLPGLGRVAVQLCAVRDGISLSLAAESSAAARALEAMLPVLVQALAKAGLSLAHWQIDPDLQPSGAAWTDTVAPGKRALPGLNLLRAGAEIVAALSRRWPPRLT